MSWNLPTNFSGPGGYQSVEGLGSLFTYATYATGNWFGTGLLFAIFILSWGGTAMMNIGRAFSAASFITFVFSVYFARINMVNPTIPLVLATMVIGGFFWAKSERSNY